MGTPLISIITPSYQQSAFIEETLLSVKGQACDNVEHIVIDGLSTDGTQEILTKYAFLYDLKWISEKDSGQTQAINKGFRRAIGDIIGWINSDDTYMPGAFKKVMKCFADNPDIDWVYGDAYWIDTSGNVTGIYKAEEFNLIKLLYVGMYIPQPTIFVRKELLNSIGSLDESINTTMDFDYCIRLGFGGQAQYIPEILATRRVHANTKTAKNCSMFYYDALTCLNRVFENEDLPRELLSIMEKVYSNRHRIGGFQLFSDRQYDKARDALKKALRMYKSFSMYELISIWLILFESALRINWITPGFSKRRKDKKDRKLYNGITVNWKNRRSS
jgi:glycosyltransferase involved in cell wall biosynthesis